MEKHMLNPDETMSTIDEDMEEGGDDDEDEEDDPSYGHRASQSQVKGSRPSRAVLNGGVTKSSTSRPPKTGLTHSKGGVRLVGKSRKKRKHYPPSWGMSAEKMQLKKRVICVYDGQRRLWKDDIMMHNEFEVRMPLANGKSYVTDLDVETLKRANAFHDATPEEKGPWVQEPAFDLEALMA